MRGGVAHTVRGGLTVVEANLRVWRRTWRGSAFSSFVTPVLYLAALGLGLGTYVDGSGAQALGGASSYAAFVAPGVLAATALQAAAGDSSWPVMAALRWTRTYHALITTPVGVPGLLLGHLCTLSLRLTLTSAAFAAVAVAFGTTDVAGAGAAVPAAVLTGLAAGAAVVVFTAAIEGPELLSVLFRFVIVPLFLLSGTFFPLTSLPLVLRAVAQVAPLWHGVELCRAAMLGRAPALPMALHLAVLVAWLAVAVVAALPLLRRRLQP